MTWNHRIMKRTYAGEISYAIHEVFYHDDGMLNGWTKEPVAPIFNGEDGDGIELLRAEFNSQMLAFDKPILDYETGKDIP